jgi:hypothetical protein
VTEPSFICAVDIDIGEFTVVGSHACMQTPSLSAAAEAILRHRAVLIEVASPICYHGDSKAATASTARWQIWNSLAAGALWRELAHGQPGIKIRVSPSNRWTMGYDEKTRHAMAGIDPVKHNKNGVPLYLENHDKRECRAMLWSYYVKPALWVPMEDYLASL